METIVMVEKTMLRYIFLLFIFGFVQISYAINYGDGNYNADLYSASTVSVTPSGGGGGAVLLPNTNTSNNQNTTVENKSIFYFSKDLFIRNRSNEVKLLQEYLNKNNFKIAPSGPGSPGKETNYFGIATKNALKKFQKAHKIPATGNLGPKTRAFINLNN